MKKVGMFIVVQCMLTGMFWGYIGIQISVAETLKITQDQFEFRDEPRVAEETLLGTLRIGTPVEWTGETSGGWFRVTAPNGQTGWVHESGLSTPKTRVQPTPKPASQTSRSISAPTSSSQSQTTLRKLQQTNEQYQSALEEKDKRIAQLTKDIEELETKLTDVAQMIDDQEQLRKVDQLKATELQDELAALQETIKQKDEALLTEKVERTKLANQLKELQAQTSNETGQERFWLYAFSLPLNLIGLLVLGFWGIRHIRHKKAEEARLETTIRERQDAEVGQERRDESEKEDIVIIPPVVSPQKEESKAHLMESGLEELDIVMAASSAEENVSEPEEISMSEEVLVDEDVVIDLADVLPTSKESSLETTDQGKEEEEIEILIEDVEVEKCEEMSSEEAGEMETTEEQKLIEETPVIEEPEEEETVEIVPEEAESITSEHEEFDQMVVIETHGMQEELREDIVNEPESMVEVEELEMLTEEQQLSEPEEILDEDMEALLEDTPEMLQDTSIEELLEEGDLEEEILQTAEEIENIPEPKVSEEIEIEGERFEMLLERNTQIIEPEEEDAFEETLLYEETEVGEEKPSRQTQEDESSSRKIEDIEKVTTFDDIAVSESFESLDKEVETSFEPEKEKTVPGEETVETVSEDQEFEKEILLNTIPSFLEPTPFLIEPEYEPEESSLASAGQEPKEPRYDIELVDAGKSPEHIIHILSKIEGLTKSPRELVEQTPGIIARGAKETDAKNFQVVMKKFGAEVRLIKKI